MLGGIVGGIIGAEIDGGHDRTAGTVIGSVVGATIGANATSSRSRSYTVPGGYDDFETDGSHRYENELYEPPREIRTCMRYEDVRGDYVCTKWSVEYIYDDG